MIIFVEKQLRYVALCTTFANPKNRRQVNRTGTKSKKTENKVRMANKSNKGKDKEQ